MGDIHIVTFGHSLYFFLVSTEFDDKIKVVKKSFGKKKKLRNMKSIFYLPGFAVIFNALDKIPELKKRRKNMKFNEYKFSSNQNNKKNEIDTHFDDNDKDDND